MPLWRINARHDFMGCVGKRRTVCLPRQRARRLRVGCGYTLCVLRQALHGFINHARPQPGLLSDPSSLWSFRARLSGSALRLEDHRRPAGDRQIPSSWQDRREHGGRGRGSGRYTPPVGYVGTSYLVPALRVILRRS